MDDKAPNLKAAQSVLGYSFRNKELLREALEPRGPWNGRQHPEGNEPLAQVGYAALSLAAVVQGYRAGMGKSPKSCRKCAKRASSSTVSADGHRPQCAFMLARSWTPACTLVGACVGAVYLDSGMDVEAVLFVMEQLGIDFDGVEA